jgi:hypothetical protein
MTVCTSLLLPCLPSTPAMRYWAAQACNFSMLRLSTLGFRSDLQDLDAVGRSHSREKLALSLPRACRGGGNPVRRRRVAKSFRSGFPPFGKLRAGFSRE